MQFCFKGKNPYLGKLLWTRKQHSLLCGLCALLAWACPPHCKSWSWPFFMHHPTGEQPPHVSFVGNNLLMQKCWFISPGGGCKSGLEFPFPTGCYRGQVRMHRSSPCLVSLPLEKLQAAGCRPRQADEGADVHAVLALTWSEGMAAVHTQIQKLFFLYIKTGNKAPCIAKQSL